MPLPALQILHAAGGQGRGCAENEGGQCRQAGSIHYALPGQDQGGYGTHGNILDCTCVVQAAGKPGIWSCLPAGCKSKGRAPLPLARRGGVVQGARAAAARTRVLLADAAHPRQGHPCPAPEHQMTALCGCSSSRGPGARGGGAAHPLPSEIPPTHAPACRAQISRSKSSKAEKQVRQNCASVAAPMPYNRLPFLRVCANDQAASIIQFFTRA